MGGERVREAGDRELLAQWLLEAELELRAAQSAVDRGRPNARARYATARADLDAAMGAVQRLLAFCPREVSAWA